jgi:hypothetical protein
MLFLGYRVIGDCHGHGKVSRLNEGQNGLVHDCFFGLGWNYCPVEDRMTVGIAICLERSYTNNRFKHASHVILRKNKLCFATQTHCFNAEFVL